MKNVRIITLALGLLMANSAARPPAAAEQQTPQASSTVTVEAFRLVQVIHTDSHELMHLTKWALGLYHQAGLELPSLGIYFHGNNEPCHGYSALHTRTDTGSRIDVCSVSRTPKVEASLLHELAHSWAAHNLTDQQRQAFVELRGLDTWHDKDASWKERGTEQAAEIIAWGLNETSRPPRWIPNNDPESLTTAYQQLTGADPITDISPEWQPGQPPTRTSHSTSIQEPETQLSGRPASSAADLERLPE